MAIFGNFTRVDVVFPSSAEPLRENRQCLLFMDDLIESEPTDALERANRRMRGGVNLVDANRFCVLTREFDQVTRDAVPSMRWANIQSAQPWTSVRVRFEWLVANRADADGLQRGIERHDGEGKFIVLCDAKKIGLDSNEGRTCKPIGPFVFEPLRQCGNRFACVGEQVNAGDISHD